MEINSPKNACGLRAKVLDAAKDFYKEEHKTVPFVAGKTYIPVTSKKLNEEDLCYLLDAALDLWLTTGRYAREFEKTFSAFFGRKTQSLLVNSGSSANLVAISSLGSHQLSSFTHTPLKTGDEVITVAAAFPTTVNPIVQNGWTPVFIDVDSDTLNATPELIESAFTSKTKAVVLAHALGNPYRADIISDWCKKNNLFFVEDCCDALGAKVNDQPVGSFSDYATCSFYPAHHITMGEGGAVISKDAKLKKIAESIRDWGRDCWCEPGKDNTCNKRFCWKLGDLPNGYDHKYVYSNVGYNLKVTDMQAAIGLSQLNKAPYFIQKRNENWNYLREGINQSPHLNNSFQTIKTNENCSPSWFGFPLICKNGKNREKIVAALEEKRIGTRLFFAGNLTKQPAYKNINYRINSELKNTDTIMNSLFWIGVHPNLDKQHMDYMLESLEVLAR